MTVPFGTDIVCGCSILLFGCKLFGTTLFLLSVNGLGLAAPTLTVRLCLLWSIWLDSTPAGRKNSKFNTRSAVQCPRIFFYFVSFLFIFCFANRLSAHTNEGETANRNCIFVWTLSIEVKGPVHTKPSEKELAVSKAVANPDLQIRRGGGGGSSIKKKNFFGPSGLRKNKGGGPPLGSTTEKCPNSCRRGLACWRSCTNCTLLFL